jgi:hypothetical protein
MSNFWQQKAMEGSSSGTIGFIGEGKTVLKIVAPENAKDNQDVSWFKQFIQYYNDKPSKKFMVYAIDVKATDKKVQPWVVNVSSMNQIFNLIGDDEFDVLSPVEGTAVSITRSGSGMNTSYNVQVSPKPFDSSDYSIDSCMSLEEAITQLTKPKEDKPANKDDDEIDW